MKHNKYGAKKASCQANHLHDSKREAKRCDELNILLRCGDIRDLIIQPVYPFSIDGKPMKMANGHIAKLTADFQYFDNGKQVCEDSKGFVVRDFPLRWALAKALYPHIEFRLV